MPNFFGDINLNKNKLQNAVIQPESSAPSNPKEGQIYYNTTDKNYYRYNGTSWVTYQGQILIDGLLEGDGSGNINAADTQEVTTLNVDSLPTANSTNLVTSGGVAAALAGIDGLSATLVIW